MIQFDKPKENIMETLTVVTGALTLVWNVVVAVWNSVWNLFEFIYTNPNTKWYLMIICATILGVLHMAVKFFKNHGEWPEKIIRKLISINSEKNKKPRGKK